jgi:hypothetical protein
VHVASGTCCYVENGEGKLEPGLIEANVLDGAGREGRREGVTCEARSA